MSVTYSADAHGVSVTYRDRKRGWWALCLVYPLMAVEGIVAQVTSGYEAALAVPLLVTYGLFPVLDAMLGEDKNNPPELVLRQLDADSYYRWLTWLTAPLHYVGFLVTAWWVGTHALSWWAVLSLAGAAGVAGGIAINTAHELGHKHNAFEQWLTRMLLALPIYGHLTVEHNQGHHRWVATPEDCASARMGESIYRFFLREFPGGVARAWSLERARLAKQGRSVWSVQNTIIRSSGPGAALQLGLILAFGWKLVPFLLVHNLAAWWQVTLTNYLGHYGLLREKGRDGRYESPQMHHSWNDNHVLTDLVLFQQQRHSHHHALASRPYQSLRDSHEIPRLPSGFFAMSLLACVPPLWFKVMDPKLLALPHVNGDLAKVNIDPRHHARLVARYGLAA
jgi:alkane 1-monooxygenase